jgi:hypothetical protein
VACAEKPGDVDLLRNLASAFLVVEHYDKVREVRRAAERCGTLRRWYIDMRLGHVAYCSIFFSLPWAQTGMRLVKLGPAEPAHAALVALAYHAIVSEPPSVSASAPAPHAITGGGRGWGLAAVPAAEARKLALAETVLLRALDAAPPEARHSEALGLLIHTMVRQVRVRWGDGVCMYACEWGVWGKGAGSRTSPHAVPRSNAPVRMHTPLDRSSCRARHRRLSTSSSMADSGPNRAPAAAAAVAAVAVAWGARGVAACPLRSRY